MFRNNNVPKIEHINCVFDDGGLWLGDHVARMSAIKYIRDNLPHVRLHLYVPDFFCDLAKNLVPRISIRPFKKRDKFNSDFAGLRTHCPQHDTLCTHLVDHAFSVLVNKQVDITHKNYCQLDTTRININKFNLPEKFVIVTTGYTAQVREWNPNSINGTVNYLIKKGYTPVFLGSNNAPVLGCADAIRGAFNEEIDFSKGINLINKTSMLEAAKIISKSAALVGLDNGLMHLAGCTEVPIVGGFTTVAPDVRMPYRHNELGWNFYPVVPDKDTCKFCQSDWALFFDHDFRYCYYADRQCCKSITAEKIIEQFERFLK